MDPRLFISGVVTELLGLTKIPHLDFFMPATKLLGLTKIPRLDFFMPTPEIKNRGFPLMVKVECML